MWLFDIIFMCDVFVYVDFECMVDLEIDGSVGEEYSYNGKEGEMFFSGVYMCKVK